MKKFLTAPLLVVFISTLAFGYQQGVLWEKFNSPEGRFNILMPSKPTLEVIDFDSSMGKMKIYNYTSTTSIGQFLVSYGDFLVDPKDANQAESVLKSVRNGIIDGGKAEVTSDKKISFYGYPGRELRAKKKVKGDEVIFTWKVYLAGRRLYQLAVATKRKDSESPDIAKFLTSFDLNK